MQLYKLAEQYDILTKEQVDIETGELFDFETAFKAKLAEIKDKIEDKAENVAKVYLMLDADVKALTDEINRLDHKKQLAKNRCIWIKQYLLEQLQLAKIDSVEKPTIKINIRTNNPSVEIVDQSLLPEDYLRIIPEQIEPDKKLILDHWKETKIVPEGAKIITDKKRVDIK